METSATSDGAGSAMDTRVSSLHTASHSKVCRHKSLEVSSLDVQDYAKDPSANGISWFLLYF